MKKIRFFKFIILLFITNTQLSAQSSILYNRPSQKATIIQRVGTTDIKVVYHSPLVKERKIFGDLVPFNLSIENEPHPWRAGANENTIISFNHSVKIKGVEIPAGSYSLHMIVDPIEWTVVFSKKTDGWGSFYYDKKDDAARIKVKPFKTSFQEWLSYNFNETQPTSTKLQLKWENTAVWFKIEVDVSKNQLVDAMNKEDKKWQDDLFIANLLFTNDTTNITEPLKWIEKSIAKEATFDNQLFKAKLLIKKGKTKKGKGLITKLLKDGSVNEIFRYAMQLLNEKKFQDCLEVLNINKSKYPKEWYAYLGLANYYRNLKTPDKKMVIENLKKAWDLAPEKGKPFARYRYYYEKSTL